MSSEGEATTELFQKLYPLIGKEFFQRIIRRDQNDDTIDVVGYTIKAALGQGENYASQMLRVRVEYSRGDKNTATAEHLSLIVKAALRTMPNWKQLSQIMAHSKRKSQLSKN